MADSRANGYGAISDRTRTSGDYLPPKLCADPNINRWHCMRGHDGAAPRICPLTKCKEADRG